MKEYSCDYRLYTRKICIIRGKLKNFKVQLLRSNALFLCRHEDTSSLRLVVLLCSRLVEHSTIVRHGKIQRQLLQNRIERNKI